MCSKSYRAVTLHYLGLRLVIFEFVLVLRASLVLMKDTETESLERLGFDPTCAHGYKKEETGIWSGQLEAAGEIASFCML